MGHITAELTKGWMMEGIGMQVILRILLSLALAAIIGCERSSKRHSAGMRTFMLVSAAVLTDLYLSSEFSFGIPVISGAAVVGIAMLSGNSILFSSKNQIKGLTTSAALWACGFMGLMVGTGMYISAFVIFMALLCGISLFPSAERYLKDRSNHFEVHLELKSSFKLQDFVATIRKLGIRIDDIEANPAYLNSGLSVYTVSLTVDSQELKKDKKHSDIIEALRSLDYIYYIEEIK
jgi:putative Mg2+ transporter-C (MgtC) family protein